MAKCAERRTPLRLRLWFYIASHKDLQMPYEKIHYNGQWQNKLFLIVIHRFPLVKAIMNAPRVCKLRKNYLTGIDHCAMVLKTPQFLCFPNIFQARNEFHRPYLNWLPNCQF
jgi:hypothetical protein